MFGKNFNLMTLAPGIGFCRSPELLFFASGAQQADIVVGLPQDMVRQQGQDDGANFAARDALNAGGLEVPEPQGLLQGLLTAHGRVVRLPCPGQQRGVLLGEGVRGLDERVLGGVQQAPDELGVLHHDLVPEDLRLLHGLSVQTAPLRVPEEGAVQLCLPNNVLQQQGIVHGEHPAGKHPFQDGLLKANKPVQQAEGGLVQLLDLTAQGRGDAAGTAAV